MNRVIAFAAAVVLKSAWLAVVIWAWPSESPRTRPITRSPETRIARDQAEVVFVAPDAAP